MIRKIQNSKESPEKPGPCLPHYTLAARQLIDQESQGGGFLCWCVSLEGFGLQALRELSLSTVGFHKNLQNLGNIVSIHTNIQQMLSESCFGL